MLITSEGGNALCAGGSGVLSRLVGPRGVSWLWWGTCLTCARGQVPQLWGGALGDPGWRWPCGPVSGGAGFGAWVFSSVQWGQPFRPGKEQSTR